MTVRTPDAPTRADADELEREAIVTLGLVAGATPEDVETAHDRLVRFLEGAPHDIRRWAAREIAMADEAYAVLADPAHLGAAPAREAAATVAPIGEAMAAVAADEYFEELGEEAGAAPRPPRKDRATGRRPARAARNAPEAAPASSGRRIVRRIVTIAGLTIAAAAIAVAGYNFGGSNVPGFSGTPAPEAAASPALDQARVAALMEKIQKNPKDIATLQELGDLFFQAGDYSGAGGWMEKVIAVDPSNVTARLALGAAQFNLGRPADAESQWRQVLRLDPKNLEARYDLGFMYLNQSPPDVASAKKEWQEVLAIAPDSAVAKTISVHLQGLDASAAPSAAPSPSAPPASVGPAASPAG